MNSLWRLAGALILAGLLGLPSPLRADSTPAPTPVCGVARDPQLVTPAGVLHVLDLAGGEIRRWSLPARSAQPALPLSADVVAFAFLAARNALLVAHSAPPRLTLRSASAATPEQPFALLPGEPCGLAATDELVIACFDHDQYQVLDAKGNLLDQETIEADSDTTTASWDGMAWDAGTRTLFAARAQGTARSAIAVPISADGALGDAVVVAMDPAAAPLDDELLTLSPDGSRLTAPDGLVLSTAPFGVETLPEEAGGDVFQVGDELFTVGDATDSGLAGCALSAETTPLLDQALLSPVLVRSAEWQGNLYLLRGELASATLVKLRPGSADLDGDRAADAQDVFPLDPVVGKDWDHDGVADKDDAFPTKVGEWQDSDGDHVGDNEDAFPDDPSEWKDSDNDGVGDNADAFPFDPNETQDSDSDGVGDHEDAFPFDPLEQVDSDGDGVGDNGDAAPADPSIQRIPIGPITAAFALDLRTKAALNAFADSLASRDTATFAFDGDHRFLLVLPGGEQLQGSTVPVGRAGSKFLLQLDVATLSALEGDFASDGDSIVANDTASTPSPALSFVPRAVLSDGVVKLTKKGVSLSLRVRFTYARDQVGARGAHGRLLWRATGTPES